jgi:hypothetical protein
MSSNATDPVDDFLMLAACVLILLGVITTMI